jgi:hypothetical protein
VKDDTCVFCGITGTNFKPEHWVSQWISRAEIGKGQGILHFVPGRDPWPSRIVDLTVEHICDDCNHHWMSDLESQTRDIALPLIRGENSTLGFDQQVKLASWCFLKVITLELGRPNDQAATYDREIYEGFKQHVVPPLSCVITVGKVAPADLFVWFDSQRRVHHTGPPVGDVSVYRTTLSIRQLVIDVFGAYIVPANVQGDGDPRWLQIWPPSTQPRDWPPAGEFSIVDGKLV